MRWDRTLSCRMRRPLWTALLMLLVALLLAPGARAQDLSGDAPAAPLRPSGAGAPPVPAGAAMPAAAMETSPDSAPDLAPDAYAAPDATSRIYIPVVANSSTLATVPPSPLPVLINGNFDSEGGWVQTQNDLPFPLVVPVASAKLGASGITSQPNILWLGGVIPAPGKPQVTVHRAVQSIRLPADYNMRLKFDYLPQSLEPVCGVDTAGLYVNGVLLPPLFRFCTEPGVPTNTWREDSADLSRFRGQEITIEFRMVTDNQHNSNLWIDNLELCGHHSGLKLSEQCPAPGWQEVGAGSARGRGMSSTTGASVSPAIAIGQVGRPYVAWSDGTPGNFEIYVRRWNGLYWEQVGSGSASGGGISNSARASLEPAVALARDGTAWVAWNDLSSGSNEIYVRRWTGSAWEEAGSGSASGSGISAGPGNSLGASLAVATTGTPYVAWTEFRPATPTDLADIYVRRFNGSVWEEVGAGSATSDGISKTAGESSDPSLAIAPNGTVYAAWGEETASGSEIYVRRFNGTGWVEVGSGSGSGGGISNNSGRSQAPALTVAADGTLWVAWVDSSGGDSEIYVRRFVGGFWQEAGAGSASGGGISNNGGPSLDPTLAASRDGRIYVAWRDQSGLNAEIYAKVWTGSAWQNVGVASAVGSGVSNTATLSSEPSFAVAPDGVPFIVWSDAVAEGEIYARRYVP